MALFGASGSEFLMKMVSAGAAVFFWPGLGMIYFQTCFRGCWDAQVLSGSWPEMSIPCHVGGYPPGC